MFRGTWTRSVLILLVLCFFSILSAAWDANLILHQTHDGKRYLWTSVNHFGKDTPISNRNLMGMAKEAYREMIADQARLARENPGWGWPGQPIPGAMAVLAVDDPDGGLNLVFASAIKGQYGGTSFILQVGRPDNEGKNILLACQNIYAVKYPTQSQPSHKTNANCAEPLAIYAYYEYFVKPADKIKTKSKPGRFAVWGPSDINAGGEPMDPCSYSYSNVFGCKELLIEQNINAVRTNVAPTDPDQLPKPAGSAEVCVFPENIRGECCTNSQRN